MEYIKLKFQNICSNKRATYYQPFCKIGYNHGYLLVKRSAIYATYLWNQMAESKGKNLLKKVSRSTVMIFRHIVSSRVEYVNIMPLAAPRVTVTPYPAIRLNAACSLSME